MLEDGLSYPLKGDNALGRILIGGLLGMFSVLIIPAFALLGYFVQILAGASRTEPEPPAFENWGRLVGDGLRATLVVIVYGIIPFVLMAFSFGTAMAGAMGDSGGSVLGSIGALGFLASLLGMFLAYYLIPAALTNMAIEGSIGAAFEFDRLKQVLLSLDYFVAWLLPFVVALLANIATFFVVLVTFGLGALLVPFIQFYVQVAVFYMFGRAFGKAIGAERTEPTVEDGTVPT